MQIVKHWLLVLSNTGVSCELEIQITIQTAMLLTNDCLAQSLFLPRADSGTFSVPGRVSPGRGTNRLDSGTFRAIRDVWQPYVTCYTTTIHRKTALITDAHRIIQYKEELKKKKKKPLVIA